MDVPGNVDAVAVHGLRAGEEPRRRGLRPRSDPGDVRRTRAAPVPAQRLADAKSHSRYSFARTLDSTERIASVVSAFASYKRSFDTVNNYYRTLDTLTPADLQAASRQYFTDDGLIVTTLSKDPLPAAIKMRRRSRRSSPHRPSPPRPRHARGRDGLEARRGSGARAIRLVQKRSVLPQLNFKLLFTAGSAQRSRRQGRPGRTDRGDDRGSRVARHDHRTDRGGPLPDGRHRSARARTRR